MHYKCLRYKRNCAGGNYYFLNDLFKPLYTHLPLLKHLNYNYALCNEDKQKIIDPLARRGSHNLSVYRECVLKPQ